MEALLRDSTLGQIVRAISGNKVLLYPEERDGFQVPTHYGDPEPISDEKGPTRDDEPQRPLSRISASSSASNDNLSMSREPTRPLAKSLSSDDTLGKPGSDLAKIFSNADMEKVRTRAELEQSYSRAMERERLGPGLSAPIIPTKTSDGITLVDWYTSDDAENPQNWSSLKKTVVTMQIYFYTVTVYMGASLYTGAEVYVEKIFGVSATAAGLGLALYVLGYGTGPMLFSPISEIPAVGRNPPYIITFIIFVALTVPTALVNDFAGLLVLRYLLGFFGSPCLATGGASLGDIFGLMKVPYAMAGWAAFAVGGPSLAPVIAGFSVPAQGWRWAQWELLWATGPILLVMFTLLPETSSATILLRRAQRLRKLTGNAALQSKSEIEQRGLSAGTMAREALWRPLQINVFDPAILFTSLYTMIIYGIYYSFFEVFPIVFVERHGFNAGELGLVFLSILVALVISLVIYFTYLRRVFEPEVRLHGLGPPERRLVPALFGCCLPPVGLFLFGWTGIARIHWIVPVIGIVIYSVGVLLIMLCLFIYIPMSYPQYAASLFAANDMFRSVFAAGAVVYSRAMYDTLGVGQGCSLMAGLCVGCIAGTFILYYKGAALRARSRFTAK